jgi:uncharacterized protein YrrD
VRCRDEHAGRVIKLVVNPARQRLTHLVVERGLLVRHDVVVPVSNVARVDGDTVVLNLTAEELKALPPYAEVEFPTPGGDWAERLGYPRSDTLVDLSTYAWDGMDLSTAWSGFMVLTHVDVGVPETEKLVGQDTVVSCHDGVLGTVDHLLLDPKTDRVRALVVRKGHLLSNDIVVPVDWVKDVQENEVILSADRSLLTKLPEYRPEQSGEPRPPFRTTA